MTDLRLQQVKDARELTPAERLREKAKSHIELAEAERERGDLVSAALTAAVALALSEVAEALT